MLVLGASNEPIESKDSITRDASECERIVREPANRDYLRVRKLLMVKKAKLTLRLADHRDSPESIPH